MAESEEYVDAVCLHDRKTSFASAVDDMTEHSATADSTGVEVFVEVDERAHSATMNDLGELVRAYGMEFGTGVATESGTILRFVEPDADPDALAEPRLILDEGQGESQKQPENRDFFEQLFQTGRVHR